MPNTQGATALLKAGADTEATTDQLFTPLLIAAFNGKLELAKRLVAAGANVEAKNKQQFTAACIAAQQGHVDLLGFLLDRSACRGRKRRADEGGKGVTVSLLRTSRFLVYILVPG